MVNGLSATGAMFVRDVNRIQQRMERAARQLSSGYRMQSASDSPGDVATILRTRSSLQRLQQVQMNLGRVQTEVDTAEKVVGQAVSGLEEAITAGARGANSTATTTSRQILAGQIEGILHRIVSLSGTTVDGRQLFSGDADSTTPYTLDWNQTPPVSTYGGAANTRTVELPSGAKLNIGRTAQEIFEGATPSENAIAGLTALRAGLLADDPAAITAALGGVRTALDHVNTEQSRYGQMQQSLRVALQEGRDQAAQEKKSLSSLEDADALEAIQTLNDARTQQQTALESRGRIPRSTLFDHLA